MKRLFCLFAAAAVAALTILPAQAQEHEDRKVENGGVAVDGWLGMVDPGSDDDPNDALLESDDDVLHVTTGPNVTYWHPDNIATGDYTVSATFSEPEYMNLNNHPHPYGLFIGGSDMGTENARFLYCAAYGNGSFIVRGFGPEPFQMNGRRAESNEAVNKAMGRNQPVTQNIALGVDGDDVTCTINGEVVATYDRTEVVGEGKIASLDGVYGIRFGHNVEGFVEDLTVEHED